MWSLGYEALLYTPYVFAHFTDLGKLNVYLGHRWCDRLGRKRTHFARKSFAFDAAEANDANDATANATAALNFFVIF